MARLAFLLQAAQRAAALDQAVIAMRPASKGLASQPLAAEGWPELAEAA